MNSTTTGRTTSLKMKTTTARPTLIQRAQVEKRCIGLTPQDHFIAARCLSEPWRCRDEQRRYSEANVLSWPARSTTRQVPPDQLRRGLHSSRLRQLQQCTKTWGTLASRWTHPDK